MGNKMCKKKVDSVDSASAKSPTPFNRIINRLHLRPNAWKSDSQLNEKQIKRTEVSSTNPSDRQTKIIHTQPLSKSSDWTEVDLEVPEKEHVHLRNPKLSIIFNNENGTPTPPPRKHKKNFREKIEAVAKNSLQAFQSKKAVEEPIAVKKKINYSCPICDQDQTTHNRDHHHHHNHHQRDNNEKNKNDIRRDIKQNIKMEKEKRKKNLSVVSLPNYDDLKLTVANFDDTTKGSSSEKQKTSLNSISNDHRKPLTGSTGKLDNYITRCRSFGSLLPQQLKKLKLRNVPPDVESDDSFGALEDWDLGLIEHYNPKDASLPRPRKEQRNSQEVMSELESLIVKEEDIEQAKPKPPVRRSESLVKKINREAAQTAQDMQTNKTRISKSPTPPPSPIPKQVTQNKFIPKELPTEEDGKVEHSSLMKILEQFSIRDKQNNANQIEKNYSKSITNNNDSSIMSSVEFEKHINSIEDFINAEKVNTDKDLNFGKSQLGLLS